LETELATYVLFRDHDSDASVLVNAEQVRLVRELHERRSEPAVQIDFGDNLSITVKSDLKSVWKALTEPDKT
jgi:hypothetical protein